MTDTFDSVYPDLLKTGLGKLSQLDARRELLALFSALEHLRRDLHSQKDTPGILQVTRQYVAGLNLFRAAGFWLVNPKDMGFEPVLVTPDEEKEPLVRMVDREIKTGRFAWALRQGGPVFFAADPAKARMPAGRSDARPGDGGGRGVFHSLAVSSQVVGMFCGLLRNELAPVNETAFSLLSVLLGAGADALATLHKTTQLTTQVETLNGLLPVCAWCKRIRNDSGYWEQIERYITSHSAATFTHSICPECQKNFEAGM
jgi:hypothetical protein